MQRAKVSEVASIVPIDYRNSSHSQALFVRTLSAGQAGVLTRAELAVNRQRSSLATPDEF
jgi:hypothetical protein